MNEALSLDRPFSRRHVLRAAAAAAFTAAIRSLVDDPERGRRLGMLGRAWVEDNASPAAVGAAYDRLLRTLVE